MLFVCKQLCGYRGRSSVSPASYERNAIDQHTACAPDSGHGRWQLYGTWGHQQRLQCLEDNISYYILIIWQNLSVHVIYVLSTFIETCRTQAAGEIYTVGFAAGLHSTVFFSRQMFYKTSSHFQPKIFFPRLKHLSSVDNTSPLLRCQGCWVMKPPFRRPVSYKKHKQRNSTSSHGSSKHRRIRRF